MYKFTVSAFVFVLLLAQNAMSLTLKKGETTGSDGQVNAGAASKAADAGDPEETVIYLAWAIAYGGKAAPFIEAVDRLAFLADGNEADGGGLIPAVTYNDMTDDYVLQGREALEIRLLSDETLSIQGRLEVHRGNFFTISNEVSLSSDNFVLPLPYGDKLVLYLHVPDPDQREWKSECEGKIDRKDPKVTDLDCALKQASRNIKLPEGTIKSHRLASRDAGMTVTGFPGDEKATGASVSDDQRRLRQE